VKTLVIRTDNSWEINENTKVDLKWLQSMVGGYIESFSPDHSYIGGMPWIGYCNEEGKLDRLPYNDVATRFAKRIGWNTDDELVGDVVFLGNDGSDDETDVPDWILEVLFKWFND